MCEGGWAMASTRQRGDMDGLGVLDTEFPLREVQQILRETARDSKRKRKLPASLMVYYVIALGLMASVVRDRSFAICSITFDRTVRFTVRWRRRRPSPRRGNGSASNRSNSCLAGLCDHWRRSG